MTAKNLCNKSNVCFFNAHLFFLQASVFSLLNTESMVQSSNHTNAKHFFWFCLQVFRQARPPQWVDCLAQMEISVKCLSQGHNEALPVRELNQRSVTFRSLTRRFTTELSPPPSMRLSRSEYHKIHHIIIGTTDARVACSSVFTQPFSN